MEHNMRVVAQNCPLTTPLTNRVGLPIHLGSQTDEKLSRLTSALQCSPSELETCYIRRHEENTGPHDQKIRVKDRCRGGKARAKSKSRIVGIALSDSTDLHARWAHAESNKSKDAQQADWHLSRLFVFIRFQVNLLNADGIMAKNSYSQRLGLAYVDFHTLKRTLKRRAASRNDRLPPQPTTHRTLCRFSRNF
jgi:hypothetical protein